VQHWTRLLTCSLARLPNISMLNCSSRSSTRLFTPIPFLSTAYSFCRTQRLLPMRRPIEPQPGKGLRASSAKTGSVSASTFLSRDANARVKRQASRRCARRTRVGRAGSPSRVARTSAASAFSLKQAARSTLRPLALTMTPELCWTTTTLSTLAS
jgi:hypothetical protein